MTATVKQEEVSLRETYNKVCSLDDKVAKNTQDVAQNTEQLSGGVGVSGTFASPTSITVVDGIITAIS